MLLIVSCAHPARFAAFLAEAVLRDFHCWEILILSASRSLLQSRVPLQSLPALPHGLDCADFGTIKGADTKKWKTCGVQVELVDYGMNSVSQGIDAMAITRVVIRPVMSCSGVTPQVCTCPLLLCMPCNLATPAWHCRGCGSAGTGMVGEVRAANKQPKCRLLSMTGLPVSRLCDRLPCITS